MTKEIKSTKFQCKINKHCGVVGFLIGFVHHDYEIPETYLLIHFLWWQIAIGKLINKEWW